jgi:predicted MPP superfamily phosphohydrolase
MLKRQSLIPFTIFAIIYFLINFYIKSALSPLIPISNSLFWPAVTTILIATFGGILSVRKYGSSNLYFIVSLHIFLAFFVGEIILAVSLFIGDIYQFFKLIVLKYFLGNEFYFQRSNGWIIISIGLFITVLLLFIYGIIRGKYAYRVVKHIIYFKDLPDAFEGFTITQISDVHAGSFTKIAEVQKGIDLINQQQSDLFVFTGDLVNNIATEIEPYIDIFSKIKAPFGQFSILGNHDYGDYVKWNSELEKRENLNRLKENHKKLGFKLLLDEHIELSINDSKIILVGIENWGLGFGERGDLEKALANTKINNFKILLSHDPSHWEAQVKNNPSEIQLTLAGHTHGMQFGIEAFGIKWSPVKYRYKHWAGIKRENNRVLNINRGFGFIGFSGRIGIWPEITVIELRKEKN